MNTHYDVAAPVAITPAHTRLALAYFAKVLMEHASDPTLPGLSITEYIGGRSQVYRALRIDWSKVGGPNLYWRKRETGDQIASNEGDVFALQALLAVPEDGCPVPWTLREAWELAPFLFGAEPLPAALERRYAALRRRLAAWLGDRASPPPTELFARAMERALGGLRVSDYRMRQAGIVLGDTETLLDIRELALLAGVERAALKRPTRALLASAKEEVLALLTRQRTGVFSDGKTVGVYLPTYVEALFDAQTTTPFLDWAHYAGRSGARLSPGAPLPSDLREVLQRKARGWLAAGQGLLGGERGREAWERFTAAIPHGADVAVVTAASLRAIPDASDPATVAADEVTRKPRTRAVYTLEHPAGPRGTRDGTVRYVYAARGVFVDPTSFRFSSYEDLQARHRAAFLAAVEQTDALDPRRGTSPAEEFRRLTTRVDGAPWVHAGTAIGLLAGEAPELAQAMRDRFARPQAEVHRASRTEEVARRRALGIPVRARFPFTPEEDAAILKGYRRYASKFYWQELQQAGLARHSVKRIRLRGRALVQAQRAGLTLEQARDRARIEKVLGPKLAKRFESVLETA